MITEHQHIDFHTPERHHSALRTMLDLTAAPQPSEIGQHGPSNAANTSEENKHVPGLDLFNEFYPRDGHIVALFSEKRHPALTRATVIASLAYTGIREHLRSAGGLQDEQEAGKVPHEIRDNNTPKARERAREKDRLYPYYGAIDTTAKNINAIGRMSLQNLPDSLDFLTTRYMSRIDGREHTVEDGLKSHINWIRKRMDLNSEGLVESLWINQKHHANHSWADSPDAFHHADGSWAQHHPDKNWGVASVEVQAEVYDALLHAIEIYILQLEQATGTKKQYLQDEIADLTERAKRLRRTILDVFWIDDPAHHGGYFARGTDRDDQGNLRPLGIRSSDMGHLLFSQVLVGDDEETRTKREAVIRNLFSPEMLAPNGIRTLASDSIRYREDTYHNGSVWLWQNRYIALGLERQGYYGLAYELKKRTWSFYNETKTLAEFGTGSPDPNKRINDGLLITVFDPSLHPEPIYHFSRYKIVQPPQPRQAWTAAAILAMKYEHGARLHNKLYPHRKPKPVVPMTAITEEKQLFERELLAQVA